MSEVNLLATTDAKVWAQEFVRLHGGDEGLMIAWFANMWAATNDPLQREIERLTADIAASAGLKCPNCDDIGYTVESYLDGRGDECPEQVQCEFCYTVKDSVFNRMASLQEAQG